MIITVTAKMNIAAGQTFRVEREEETGEYIAVISDEEDLDLVCVECEKDFIFSVSERQYFQDLIEKGVMSEFHIPKRCKTCRHNKKTA